MTTPRVTEMPLRLEPAEPDPFVETLSSAFRARLTEREEHEPRVEPVPRDHARDDS